MKKVLLFSLFFFLGINITYASTSTAYSYTLMDMDTGRVIESKNKDTPMLIASITKIMTCILAIENEDIKLSLFADNIILYIENPKNSIKILLDLINSLSKVVGYKLTY